MLNLPRHTQVDVGHNDTSLRVAESLVMQNKLQLTNLVLSETLVLEGDDTVAVNGVGLTNGGHRQVPASEHGLQEGLEEVDSLVTLPSVGEASDVDLPALPLIQLGISEPREIEELVAQSRLDKISLFLNCNNGLLSVNYTASIVALIHRGNNGLDALGDKKFAEFGDRTRTGRVRGSNNRHIFGCQINFRI